MPKLRMALVPWAKGTKGVMGKKTPSSKSAGDEDTQFQYEFVSEEWHRTQHLIDGTIVDF